MNLRFTQGILMAAMATAVALPAVAADPAPAQKPAQARDQIRDQDIYGYGLMTPQERNDYRARMRAARTVEERERIRKEHHEQMKVRARERGVTLPDEPPAGRGPGTGPGPGGGKGPGGGRQ
jgi:hypothetical protein